MSDDIAPSDEQPTGESVPALEPPPSDAVASGEAAAPESAPMPAPAAAPQPLTADALAQAMGQTFAPVFQQLAPRPPAPQHPWSDPRAYWNLSGVPEEQAHQEFHRRQEAFAKHVAAQEIESALAKQRQEFAQALNGQSAYFNAVYKPEHQPYRAHFEKYLRQGIPEEFAARLAKQDAGLGAAAPGAQGPRPAPKVPAHATSPQTRTSPTGKPQAPKGNVFDKNERERRFAALKLQHGYSEED